MDEKLKATIDKIVLLTKQNPEFEKELLFRLKAKSQDATESNSSVKNDVLAIRSALEIRANHSVSYDFIKHQRLRDQLTIDNLRMENAALNLKEDEISRFYTFCVNAFYQIENVVNYFFHTLYPDIEDLLRLIEEETKNNINRKTGKSYQFKRIPQKTYKTVGDIDIIDKLNAICNMLFPSDSKLSFDLSNLRQVRNEGEHRCHIIYKDETEKLHKFFKDNSFNTIRIMLIKLIDAIKEAIISSRESHPPQEHIVHEAVITSLLPSACFIKFDGKTGQLPPKFLQHVREKKVGDSIKLKVKDGEIIGVES